MVLQHGKHAVYRHIDIEEGEGQTTKEMVWEMADREHCDIVVVGNHGRKGPKADETVCGTVIEHTAKDNSRPVIIIKDFKPRSVKPDGCFRFGVCYDGSRAALKAFEITCNIMRPTDKLAVIAVASKV